MRRPVVWLTKGFRAFTLIELLVVILILGILMAVAVPTFLRQQSKAQDSRTQQYLTTAFKAIRSGIPDTNNQYPSSTSLVSWVQQSEPELAVQRAGCYTGTATAPTDAVLVDPSSSGNALLLCARSASGNVWELSATGTSAPTLINGTLVPLTFSGSEVTDATRAADVQGDGLSSDSSTGIWEATTNLVPNGGLETNINNVTQAGGGTVIKARDTSEAKFGTASVKVITDGTAGNGVIFWDTSGANSHIAVAASTIYTASAWIAGQNGGEALSFGISFYDSSGGVLTTSSINLNATTAFARYAVTAASPSNAAQAVVRVQSQGSAYTFWVDGVQLEQKAFATPYVETNGASASRAGAGVQAPASLLSSSQGWFAARLRYGFSSTAFPVSIPRVFDWRNNGSNILGLRWNTGNGSWETLTTNAGVVTKAISPVQTFSIGSFVTVIGSWTSSTLAVSVNGGPFTTFSAAHPVLTASLFDIGSFGGSTNFIDSDVLWSATGTGTLTDADAATINSWGNTDPTRASFPASAQATMTWNGTSTTGSLK